MTGFDDLHQLALDLSAAPEAALPLVKKAVQVSALKGKEAWQDDARRHRMTPGYAASIDYDPVDKNLSTDIGPNLSRGGTPGFGVLEDSPGGVRGTPRRSYIKAEEVIEDDLPKGVEIAIDQALREHGL